MPQLYMCYLLLISAFNRMESAISRTGAIGACFRHLEGCDRNIAPKTFLRSLLTWFLCFGETSSRPSALCDRV